MTQKELMKLCSKPEMVKLVDIDGEDETFQTRRLETLRRSIRHQAQQDSEKEIKALKQELEIVTDSNEDKRKRHLKAIIIFRDPEADATTPWLIVSGFHRYKAYLLFNKTRARKDQRKNVIPAQIFTGTADQAMMLSASMDTKPILSKNKEQKMNAAWELIRTENSGVAKMSVQRLAELTGVSVGTVHNMKKALVQLQANHGHIHENWRVQQWALKGNVEDNQERDVTILAKKLANQLADQVQTVAQDEPELQLAVLKMLTERLFPHVEPERILREPFEQARREAEWVNPDF